MNGHEMVGSMDMETCERIYYGSIFEKVRFFYDTILFGRVPFIYLFIYKRAKPNYNLY